MEALVVAEAAEEVDEAVPCPERSKLPFAAHSLSSEPGSLDFQELLLVWIFRKERGERCKG